MKYSYRFSLSLVFLLLGTLAACSTSGPTMVSPGKDVEAVRDFIAATDLTEVNKIRLYEQLKYLYVNDEFIVFPTSRGDYLIEFRGPCTELRRRFWSADMVDFRVSARVLQADFDTLRGCGIKKIYELPEAQFEELRVLGDAPGQGEYARQSN